MTKDPIVNLLTQRAKIMSWLEACPEEEEEDETVAGALAELDQRIALQQTTSLLGKSLAAAFLEHELDHLLDGAPAVQRNVVLAYHNFEGRLAGCSSRYCKGSGAAVAPQARQNRRLTVA